MIRNVYCNMDKLINSKKKRGKKGGRTVGRKERIHDGRKYVWGKQMHQNARNVSRKVLHILSDSTKRIAQYFFITY